jgi:hypothetical protein
MPKKPPKKPAPKKVRKPKKDIIEALIRHPEGLKVLD